MKEFFKKSKIFSRFDNSAKAFLSDSTYSDIFDISQFDAIVIPRGEEISSLYTDQHIVSLLSIADENGLVIAGIGNGTLIQANAGLINNKKFTTHNAIIANLTSTGGIYVDNANVVTDDNIITAISPNYEEISYAIANAMGYSYSLDVDISFEKEHQGWNYSLTIESSDKYIISRRKAK